jgi:hypothetical protein
MAFVKASAWIPFGAACAAAMCVSIGAHAQTYKWVDPQGRVQYTDRLPADAVNRGNVQLSKQGVAKAVVEPALTAEQRLAIEERLARERDAEKVAKERQLQEKALLASYTSEEDIEIARKRNLALIGAAIVSAEARIKTLQNRMAAIEKEKLFYEKRPVPEKLKREQAAVEAEIPRQYTLIARKNEDALAINQRYDEQRAQYLDLRNKLATQAPTAKRQ